MLTEYYKDVKHFALLRQCLYLYRFSRILLIFRKNSELCSKRMSLHDTKKRGLAVFVPISCRQIDAITFGYCCPYNFSVIRSNELKGVPMSIGNRTVTYIVGWEKVNSSEFSFNSLHVRYNSLIPCKPESTRIRGGVLIRAMNGVLLLRLWMLLDGADPCGQITVFTHFSPSEVSNHRSEYCKKLQNFFM